MVTNQDQQSKTIHGNQCLSLLRDRTHANFCLFCPKKKLSQVPWDKCAQWFLDLPIQRYHRPASEQDKFLSGVKSDSFVNLHAMIWRKMSIKKIWSLLMIEVFQPETRQNCFIFARQSKWKIRPSVSCITILTQYGSQVYVPVASAGPSTVQFLHL